VSGFQLAASLASSLAWPVLVAAILIFAWSKRRAISELLNLRSISHGRTLRRVRAGPVELEWDQLIESTAKQISDAVPMVDAKPRGTVRRDLDTVASSVPAAAVLEGFARLERQLRVKTQGILDTHSEPGRRRIERSVLAMARSARDHNLISEEILSGLRNEAAHRVGGDDITTEQAREYLDLVDSVIEAMS